MKRALDFDPAERHYGPATESVRAILRRYADVEWFSGGPVDHERALHSFREHHARSRHHSPTSSPASIEVRVIEDDWRGFEKLCARVRRPGAWEWKFAQLKHLVKVHSRACGWSPEENTPSASAEVTPLRPGDLFLRHGDVVIWLGLGLKKLPPEWLSPARSELASWYLSYADFDALHAIEWQLAKRGDDADDNPFMPLIDCYAAGVLPFGLAPNTFVLLALKG